MHINPAMATDEPRDVGEVDLILLGVKLYDVETAVTDFLPILGPETGVVSLQNGIDAPAMITRIVGAAHCIPGVALLNGEITAPGVIQHNAMNVLSVGELDGRISPRLEALRELAEGLILDVTVSADIELELWRKFLRLTAISGMSTLTRLPMGRIRENTASWKLIGEALREIVAVAQGEGIAFGEQDIEETQTFLRDIIPETWRGSLYEDLHAGRRLEVEWLHGTICRLSEKHGLETPFHRIVHGALMPHADGA
jgi:2-dehydropantoate 2-reductase